jgi:hypothetical protein
VRLNARGAALRVHSRPGDARGLWVALLTSLVRAPAGDAPLNRDDPVQYRAPRDLVAIGSHDRRTGGWREPSRSCRLSRPPLFADWTAGEWDERARAG